MSFTRLQVFIVANCRTVNTGQLHRATPRGMNVCISLLDELDEYRPLTPPCGRSIIGHGFLGELAALNSFISPATHSPNLVGPFPRSHSLVVFDGIGAWRRIHGPAVCHGHVGP